MLSYKLYYCPQSIPDEMLALFLKSSNDDWLTPMVRKNHFPLGSWNRNLVLLYSVGTLPWLTGWKWEWICHSFFFPSPWHLCWLSETAILFVRRRCQRHRVLQRNKEIISERQEIIQLTTISCSHGKSSTNANAWVPLIRRHCLAF